MKPISTASGGPSSSMVAGWLGPPDQGYPVIDRDRAMSGEAPGRGIAGDSRPDHCDAHLKFLWLTSSETNRFPFWITWGDPTAAIRRFPEMMLIAPHSFGVGAIVSVAAIRYSRRGTHSERRHSRRMPNEIPDGAALDAARWAALIDAVALRKDREAFAALFAHFAPRIKTFMLRSG